MFKNFPDYENYVKSLDRRKHDVDAHHCLPISCYGQNVKENIASMLMVDHKKVHQQLDIAYRYFNNMIRKQRMLENWHIVLTTSDIEGRADIQRAYLSGVHKLVNYVQDMHEVKLWELTGLENEKLFRLTNDRYKIQLWDTLQNHQTYVDIQKEISKAIYSKIKK